MYVPGEPAQVETRTGKVSGKSVQETVKEGSDNVYLKYNANTNGEKVIALTFDDGPWPTTSELLDVLKENDAVATFFTIGEQISDKTDYVETIQRMAAEGHQIGTHSYDHAATGGGNGVDMTRQSPEKQISKSRETMDIYAPLAHRLGMQKIKWELEDTSLKYLDPEGYNEIMRYLNAHQAEADAFMKAIQSKITTRLSAVGIHGSIYGRIKHVYSIYRKMKAQNKTIDELYDMYAFRVIVDSIPDCYNVLGHIHDLFNLVPGRFKDYISTPKPNMYQSLHTTVIGQQGIPFEVQIRTWEMHETAEYGIAAHWKYKQGVAGGDEKQFEWVRRLLETQQDSDAEDYIHSLKVDMFDDEVFVFTPKGKVMSLPSGSTPIDFAYAIHSGVGNAMVGAKVNNRIASYDQQLCNGDIVEVLTSKTAKGPSRDWLNICKSNGARTKIKQWFKKEKREENIVHGKASFEGEMRRANVNPAVLQDAELLPGLLKKLSFDCLDDMYAAIGYGGLTAAKAFGRIRDDLIRATRQTPAPPVREVQKQPRAGQGRPPQGFRRYRRGYRFLHDQVLALLHAGAGRRHRRLYHKGLRRVHPPPRLPQCVRRLRPEAGRALGQGRVEHGGQAVLHHI